VGRYDEVETNRVSHLQMIQAVIGRLGNDSFLIKGWAVTIAGALLGFAVDQHSERLAVLSLIPTLLFWVQDSLFLRSERLFRLLHEEVRKPDSTVEPFFMNATATEFIAEYDKKDAGSWPRAFFRPTLLLFYLLLAIAAIVLSQIVK
jgi:uncharacterized membrane protein